MIEENEENKTRISKIYYLLGIGLQAITEAEGRSTKDKQNQNILLLKISYYFLIDY